MPLIVHSTCRAPASHGGQAVGDGQAEVVVAVDADDRLIDVGHALAEGPDHAGVLGGRGVADGVGDVHGGRARLDGGLDDVAEEVGLGPGGVLGAELDVGADGPGAADALDGPLDDLLAGHLQLVLAVDRRGGQEDVDPRLLGVLERLPGAVDVAVVAAGEPADGRAGDLGGDGADGLEVALRGDREPGLDDVDAERGQGAGHLHLLGLVHARARRLLAVAQGRVEDPDPVRFASAMAGLFRREGVYGQDASTGSGKTKKPRDPPVRAGLGAS